MNKPKRKNVFDATASGHSKFPPTGSVFNPQSSEPLQPSGRQTQAILAVAGVGLLLIVCCATTNVIGYPRICGSLLFLVGLATPFVRWIRNILPDEAKGCVPGCLYTTVALCFVVGIALLVGGEATVNLVKDLSERLP